MTFFVKSLVKKILFPILLFLLISLVFYKNVTFGSFLSGWDNLMPELNFRENIARSLSASWQEYQGLGLLGGMAHTAALPRELLLFGVSLFLSISAIRYFWTFLMLFLGPLGVYFFIHKAILRGENFVDRLAGFAGGAFYLFNLATVQYFFVPFEAFVSFYGFLPWFLYFALKYLKEGQKKDLFLFVLVSFLGATAFYVQTLFIVYFVFLIAFSIETIIRFRKAGLLRVLRLGFFVFLVNSFWLLPVLYFTLTSSFVPAFSHINSIATPETQLMNQAAGDWKDVLHLKGFWFNYYDFFVEGGFDYLFRDWVSWVQKREFLWISLSIFVFSFLGLVALIFRKKIYFGASLFLLCLICYLMLASRNFPFGFIFDFLTSKIPLFAEIFRSVFTKWSVAFAFVLSCGLGGLVSVFDIFSRRFFRVFLSLVLTLIVLVLSVFSVWPAFEGNLIAKKMRVQIPTEYFGTIDWFNRESDGGRVAILPFVNQWGWMFTNWGYSGSGFLWYGIKNPILDRAFDVWSPYNEGFYNEASSALYKYHLIFPDKVRPCQTKKECEAEEKLREGVEDWNREVIKEFEKVLEKYDVSYLLLDESIINAGGDNKLLYLDQIKDLVAKSSRVKEVARFGFLTVYHFAPWAGSDSVQAPRSYYFINADLKYSKYDHVYQKYGDYFSAISHRPSVISFPFVNFDPRGPVKIQEVFENGQNWLKFENNNANAKVLLPIAEKIEEKFGEEQGFDEGYNCDLKKKGRAVKTRLEKGNFYGAYDGGVSCDWFYYPNLDRSRAWAMRIKGKNLLGRSLKIYLQNLRTGRMDLEELLRTDKNGEFDSYFVIYPSESADLYKYTTDFENTPKGFTLNVETRSFGRISSKNIIEDITFIPIDTNWISQLRSALEEPQEVIQDAQVIGSKKYGTFAYKFKLGSSQENRLLTISQGSDEGWIAFTLKNRKVNYFDHVNVNGWKNGWIIPASESDVFVFFWPQSLQWIGFGFLGLSFAILLFGRGKQNS